ncbi:MAG: hypothetical protein U0869_08895 [Chloroflexota bacterium]
MAGGESLRRLGGGRWQTRDERFTIEPQSGRWVVLDAQQQDDFGMPLVRGPFGSLDDAREAIAGAREEPAPASPLTDRPVPSKSAPAKAAGGMRYGTLPYAPSSKPPKLTVVRDVPAEEAPAPAPTKDEARSTKPGGLPFAPSKPRPRLVEPEPVEPEPVAPEPEVEPAKARAASKPVRSKAEPKPTSEPTPEPEPAPKPAPSAEPEWIGRLPAGQRSGARALVKRLAAAGLPDAAEIARTELESDEPAIARAVLERRIRELAAAEDDPARLAAALLALVADGGDAELEVRWRLVDGDERPIGPG